MAPVKFLSVLVAAFALLVLPLRAEEAADRSADEAAILALAAEWEGAWNRRDAEGLAAIMDANVVFVSVLGPDTPGYGRGGKAAFEAGHAQILKTMFKDSVWTNRQVDVVRFVKPDVAIAQVIWETTGDKVRHIKHGLSRRGIFTWVLEKQEGGWRVVASQNTEVMPPLPGQ